MRPKASCPNLNQALPLALVSELVRLREVGVSGVMRVRGERGTGTTLSQSQRKLPG
jgi:hypothetical protein